MSKLFSAHPSFNSELSLMNPNRSYESKAKIRWLLAAALLPLSWGGSATAQSSADDQVSAKTGVVRFEGAALPSDNLGVRDTMLGETPVVVPGIKYGQNDKVGKIEVEVAGDNLPADGHSANHVMVKVYGKDGKLLTGESYVTIELGGTARLKFAEAPSDELGGNAFDQDRATPGSQVRVINGVVEFDVLAPAVPGDIDLRATAGVAQAAGKLSYLNELRPMLAVGIIEGVVSKHRVNPGKINAINPNDGFEQDLQNWSHQFVNGTKVAGRAAFFAKGQIAKDTSITVAYDSDKDTRSRIMRDISPELYYPVTGDSSITGFDARTSSRGYLRVDRGRSYALYGDFNTGDGFSQLTGGGSVAGINVRKFGAYNRSVTGIRLHNENSRYVANGFAMYDRLRQSVEQYPLNGTSILPFVDHTNAIVDSEKVEIVTYDKNLRTQIVGVTPLIRYQDYAFEPFNGRIRLLGGDVNFLDPQGNPRFIRITYENDQDGGENFFSYGGDAQLKVVSGFELGGSFAREQNPLGPFTLFSGNATLRLGKDTVLVGEVAHSDAMQYVQSDGNKSSYSTGSAGERPLDLSGLAYRAELSHQSKTIAAKGFYEQIEPGFVNQSVGITQGQTTIGGNVDLRLGDTISVYADVSRIQDNISVGRPARSSEEGGIRWSPSDRLSLTGALHHIREDAGLTSQLNLPGNYGGIFNPNGLTLSGANFGNPGLTNIANTRDIDTTTVRLGASYKLTKRLSFDGDFEHSITNSDQRRYAVGSSYQLAERTRFYARYEDQTGLGSGLSLNQGDRSNAFVAGFDSSYRERSQIYSEYRLRDAESAQNLRVQDMQLASGIRRAWKAGDGITFSSNIEYLKVFQGGSRDALGFGAGMDFTGNKAWKGSLRGEFRRVFDDPSAPGNQQQDQYLATASVAHKLGDDWTLLVRNYFLLNTYKDDATGRPSGNIVQDRAQIGVAFRPVGDDRLIGLARYDYRVYRDRSGIDGINYNAHIAALNLNWHPTRRFWFDTRLAGETRKDIVPNSVTGGTQVSTFNAGLASGRAIYDVTDRIDLSVMGAVMHSNQSDATQHAAGLEAGYVFAKNIWISGGYNWSGFSNADLSGTEYHNRGWYARLRIKFTEHLFGM